MRVTGPEGAPSRYPASPKGLRARVLAGPEPDLVSRTGLVEVELAPGASLPAHAHGEAETLVYVVSGRGRFVSGASADELVGGGGVHLPRGAPVAVANLGVDALRLLVVLSPAGFELPRRQRHRTVIASLEALEAGTPLVIVNDHEPVALERQLRRRYGPGLGWELRERSGDRVAVAIWLAASTQPGPPAAEGAIPVGPSAPAS